MSEHLNGPATGGFNNDISTVPPTELPPRRTVSLKKGDRSTPSSPLRTTRKLSRTSQLTSSDGRALSEAPEEVEDEAGLAQEEVGSTAGNAAPMDNADILSGPGFSPSASNSDDGNGGMDTPEQLLEKATSTVTGLRMRILRFTPS